MQQPVYTKRDFFRKYAKILQQEEKSLKSPARRIPSLSSNDSSKSGMLEKFIQMKQERDNPSTNSIPTILKSPTTTSVKNIKISRFIPHSPSELSSTINFSGNRLLSSTHENYYGLATSTSDRILDDLVPKSLKSNQRSDGFSFNRSRKIEPIDSKDHSGSTHLKSMNQNPSLRATKSQVPLLNPYKLVDEKEVTIEDLYNDTKDFGEELTLLINQEYDEPLKESIKELNTEEFIQIQKVRLNNVIDAIEKIYVRKAAKDSKIKQETWGLVTSEINRIKAVYDDFLEVFKENVEKNKLGRRKLQEQMKPWEALKKVLEYNHMSRAMKTGLEMNLQRKMNETDKAVQNFKLEYKHSKESQPEILQIFEGVETLLKELNELLDSEASTILEMRKERQKLMKENESQFDKTEVIKNEMLEVIQGWKKDMKKNRDIGIPKFQQDFIENESQQLSTENLKLFEENIQFKKEIKELKKELARVTQAQEKAAKEVLDKGTMVDFYSQDLLILPAPKITSYIKDPTLCLDGTNMSDDLMFSIMNLVYSDKAISDICDDYEKRTRMPLNSYLSEWFITKFGLFTFSEAMLKDFMFNLNNSIFSTRYRVFRELLGVESQVKDTFKFSRNKNNPDERIGFKKVALGSSEMLRQFYRVVHHVRDAWFKELDGVPHANFGPFLPIFQPGEDLMSLESAKKVLVMIIKEEKFTTEEIVEIDELFFFILQDDIQKRALDRTGAGYIGDDDEQGYIRFDTFLRFLMEILAEKHLGMLDRYYTSLKAQAVQLKNYDVLLYDEYVASVGKLDPTVSLAWKGHTFAALMENNNSNVKVPTTTLMKNFMSWYFEENKVKESINYHRFPPTYHQLEKTVPLEKNKKGSISKKVDKSPKINYVKSGTNINFSSLSHLEQVVSQGNVQSSRERILNGYKQAFELSPHWLSERMYDEYDVISSLVVLQEVYYLFEEKIVLAEKSVDSLMHVHEDFLRDMEILPKKISKLPSYELITIYSKEEIVDFAEHLWTKFRHLLFFAFKGK